MGEDAGAKLFFGVVINREDVEYEDEESWPFSRELDKDLAHALGVEQPEEEWTKENSETVYSPYWDKCREAVEAHPTATGSCGYTEENDITLYVKVSTAYVCDYGNMSVALPELVMKQTPEWIDQIKELAKLLNLTIDESKIGWTLAAEFG